MRLYDLIEGIEGASLSVGGGDIEVSSIVLDSRLAEPGCLFAALQGEKFDGNDFVEDAIEAGAGAVLSQQPAPADIGVAWVEARDARAALARMAKRWYSSPDEELMLVGITGTNGKTSVAHMLHTVFGGLRGPAGMIGTISYHTGEREIPAPLTTPEAPDTFRMLREMRDFGCRSAVIEASSHAIDRHRVDDLDFDALVFTNLTRDHLDYHGDMESYYRVKRSIFFAGGGRAPKAVINVDDDWGRRLAGETDLESLTFGFAPEAQVRGADLRLAIGGSEVTVHSQWGSFKLRFNLIGRPNTENMLAAFSTALALGFDGEEAAALLATVPTVRGRLERVPGEYPFDVIIDYAHTDDALRRLLLTARELTEGRVIVVFGCGGDRDRGKRPLMGRHAVTLADVAILTSDNPRSEDPMAIIREVESGIEAVTGRRAEYYMIPDRAEAIRAAVGAARPGDMVLVAGKGHEDYQIIGDRRLDFDDREAVLEALSEL